MTAIAPETAGLVERAAWYEAMALLFRYPDCTVYRRLKQVISGLDPEFVGAPGRVALQRLQQAVRSSDVETFRAEHGRMFTGAGLCRTNENDYERLSFSMTQKLADVAGFYRAFGFERDPTSGERDDFIGTELEFARLLLLKEAYAVEQGWHERAAVTRDARQRFLHDHLSRWIPALCVRLAATSPPDGLFNPAADLLPAFVEAEAARSDQGDSS